MTQKIVFSIFGSLGDFYPYLPIALELKKRGYQPIIAADEGYRLKIEAVNLDFAPLRPSPFSISEEELIKLYQKAMSKDGLKYMIGEVILRYLKDTYEDLAEAVQQADLLISHLLLFAAPLVAEKTKIPWIATLLAPGAFISIFDPPPIPTPIGNIDLRFFNLTIRSWILNFAKWNLRYLNKPINKLRFDLGLASNDKFIFEQQYSSDLVLGLFSSHFSSVQPDWPPNTYLTGFPFYDSFNQEKELSPELKNFLTNGEPPIIFTLGASAKYSSKTFYSENIMAVNLLNCRAVFIGVEPEQLELNFNPKKIFVCSYAPYSQVFPLASVIVHHGGIGTFALSLRSSCPSLIVPFSQDHLDNAAKAKKLGVARILKPKRYKASKVVSEIKKLQSKAYIQQTKKLGNLISSENGVAQACDRIEAYLKSKS